MYSSGSHADGSRYLPAVLLVITTVAFFFLQSVIGPTARCWQMGSMSLYQSGGGSRLESEPRSVDGTSLARDSFEIEDKEPFEITVSHWLNYVSDELVLWPGRGMMPLKVEVKNKGSRKRKLEIGFYEAANLDQSLLVSYFKSLEIAPGETKSISFFLPLSEYLDECSRIECVAWDGETRKNVGSLMKKKAGVSDSFDMVGATPALYGRSILWKLKNKFYLAKFDPLSLSADWRVYSSMDGFFMTGEEWGRLSELHRKALLDWVNTGGLLFICGGESASIPQTQEYGWGHIFTLERRGDPEQLSEVYETAMKLISEKKLVRWKDPAFRTGKDEKKDAERSDIVDVGLHDISEKPREICERELSMLPDDVAQKRVLGKWLVYVLMVFVLAGPVSFFLLLRGKGERRLLGPVLFASLAGAGIAVWAIWLDSGSSGTGNRFVLVQLSPDSPKAYVSQSQIMMTAPKAGKKMDMDEGTLFFADEFVRTSRGQKWKPKSKVFRNEKGIAHCFAGGTLQHHHLSRYVSLAGGVCAVPREGEAPVLYSTLPVPLKDIVYTDENGRMWIAESLPPQGHVVPGELPSGSRKDNITGRGYFVARGESCPGIPVQTLNRVKWSDRIIFRGLVKKKGYKE